MYKLKLCLRYLRTRGILLFTIFCVMLGVGTMIIVNGVMTGFSKEMQSRMHGVLSDVTLEGRSTSGFPDAQAHMDKIRQICGDKIASLTPICQTIGLLTYQINGNWFSQQVCVIGIDPNGENETKDFGKYFQHPSNRNKLSFELRENGYEKSPQGSNERPFLAQAGWAYRRTMPPPPEVIREKIQNPAEQLDKIKNSADEKSGNGNSDKISPNSQPDLDIQKTGDNPAAISANSAITAQKTGDKLPEKSAEKSGDGLIDLPDLPADPHQNNEKLENKSASDEFAAAFDDPVTAPQKDASGSAVNDPFNQFRQPENVRIFDPRKEQHAGIIVGISLVSMRRNGEEKFFCIPGCDVKLTMASCGTPPTSITDNFTVVDLYESKMSEFDSSFVFIPLDTMQHLRGMFDPASNKGMINTIRIKLKDEKDGPIVRDMLRDEFDAIAPGHYVIETWQDKRNNLLSAVEVEKAVLNVLLFLIIFVCGFNILTIFYMIVAEKIKDIGILKALGASSSGIMGIFLLYGLVMGLVGSGLGLLFGLCFTRNINQISDFISKVTGRPIFDPDIYYFYRIPVYVEPSTVIYIMLGAILIAVLASIFPAWRAASMQPVETLRS